MRFSTRSRYGLRTLIYLGAQADKGGLTQLKDVANKEQISIKYLEQIVRVLKPSGLLVVSRGSKGGYQLAPQAYETSLYQIFTFLEGSLEPIDCLGKDNNCSMSKECVTLPVWIGLSNVIRTYLESIKLRDLVDSYKKNNMENIYYI